MEIAFGGICGLVMWVSPLLVLNLRRDWFGEDFEEELSGVFGVLGGRSMAKSRVKIGRYSGFNSDMII